MENLSDCVTQNTKPKSDDINKIVRLARKSHWTYDDWRYVSRRVREKLELHPEDNGGHKIPRLLTGEELRRYMDVLRKGGDLTHELLIKVMLSTGVRVHELVNIEVGNVDLQACKIHLEVTKGGKPREVLFPESLRAVLQAFIQSNPKRRYLFENSRHQKFSTRRIQQIVREYAFKAGIQGKVHPHLFRHMALTRLSGQMSDGAVRVLSGHSKGSRALEVYQHLASRDIARQYQEVMRDFV